MKTPKETPTSWSDMHSRESRRHHRAFFFIFLIAAYLIFVSVAWAAVYSPIFRIKSIQITGNMNVPDDDVMTMVKADIYRDSLVKRILGIRNILIWPKSFPDDILKFYPELKSVSVEKNYVGREIKIIIKEKELFGVWCLKGPAIGNEASPIGGYSNCFWFDSDGIIFKKAIDVEGNLIVSVNDYSQKNAGLNQKILPDTFISNIFSIFRAVSRSGLKVKEMRLNDLSLEEIEVDTYDDGLSADLSVRGTQAGASAQAGPKIYFSLRFPADNAPDVISSLKEKSGFSGLQYVDFRVENRVYYK